MFWAKGNLATPFISLGLLLVILTGCAVPATQAPAAAPVASAPAAPAAPAASAAPKAAAAGETVTIRFQDWRLAEKPAGPSLEGIIKDFMAANPGIKVELESVSNTDKINKFVTQFRGGTPPDVVRMNIQDIASMTEMGALVNLEPFIKESGGQALKDRYTPFLVSASTVNGNMTCIPHEGDSFLLYLNGRLFKEAGLDADNPPKTFEEWQKANVALTNPTKNRWAYGMEGAPASSIWMQSWFTAFGADFFNADYTDTLIDSPKAIEAFKYYTDMYVKDKAVPPGPTEVTYGAQVTLFTQEKVAYIQGPYATYGNIVSENPALKDVLKVTTFPGTKATAGRGTSWCIGQGSKHTAEAWKLIEWLNTDANQLRFFEEGTMLPTSKTALAKIDFAKYPVAKVMVEQSLPLAKSYPVFAKWPQAREFIEQATTAVLLGQKQAEPAIKEAAVQVRKVLQGK